MNMADRIQLLRKTKGLSQEELADKIGVSRQAVSKWESEQSVPDIDKIMIMSDYFETTTDYLLKGIEPAKADDKGDAVLVSRILYVASTALIFIGLLCAFANWYERQLAEDMGGAMIIQVVGVVAYFIGRILSHEKPAFYVNFLNAALLLFMPVSMVSGVISIALFQQGWVAPYPVGIWQMILFSVIYLSACILIFAMLRKKQHKFI